MIILTSRNTSTKTLKERHRNIKKFVLLLNKISIANNTYLLCPLKASGFNLFVLFLRLPSLISKKLLWNAWFDLDQGNLYLFPPNCMSDIFQGKMFSIITLPMKLQKQPPEVFYKKVSLKNFAKFTGKHLRQTLFFNKVADLSLQLY